MAAVFVLLLWLWPNCVHEPLHWAALKLTGGESTVNFNWVWPAHPSTTRLTAINSVWQGLFFMLLPSIVSVAILLALASTPPNVWTHFVLGTYLTFDLLVNISGFQGPISDFHFIAVLPKYGMPLTAMAVLLVGGVVLARVIPRVIEVVDGRSSV
jgi:hypothetical protein